MDRSHERLIIDSPSEAFAGKRFVEWWSCDDRFGVRISVKQIENVLGIFRSAYPQETGGILIGSYATSLDCAVIESMTKPPKDSHAGTIWFKRGYSDLKIKLKKLWTKRRYYLGEWHTHPNGTAFPSPTDRAQMEKIIASNHNDCQHPILIIFGGNPSEGWQVGVFVFVSGESFYELLIPNK